MHVYDPIHARLVNEATAASKPYHDRIQSASDRRISIIVAARKNTEKVLQAIQIIGAIAFLVGFIVMPLFPQIVLSSWVGLPIVYFLVKRQQEIDVQHSLELHKNELNSLEYNASEARKQAEAIDQLYEERIDKYNQNKVGYPADWEERRKRVLQRDGYACVECGYPQGFRRRSRQLHVHHVKSVNDGGNNNLSNLVTLCHICHRKVDKRHAGVRKWKSQ